MLRSLVRAIIRHTSSCYYGILKERDIRVGLVACASSRGLIQRDINAGEISSTFAFSNQLSGARNDFKSTPVKEWIAQRGAFVFARDGCAM